MPEHDPVRDAARYRVERDSAGERERAGARGRRRGRMENRHLWVDVVIDQAIARGEFDDLPLAGKPIPGIAPARPGLVAQGADRAGADLRRPAGGDPAAQGRRGPGRAAGRACTREDDVRAAVEEFNARIVSARRQLMGGPPVVTPLRDVDREVRRVARATPAAGAAAGPRAGAGARRRWRRRPSALTVRRGPRAPAGSSSGSRTPARWRGCRRRRPRPQSPTLNATVNRARPSRNRRAGKTTLSMRPGVPDPSSSRRSITG